MDELRERVLTLLRRAQADYGYGDALIERELAKVADIHWQAHLLDMTANTIGVPSFWSTPRAVLEVGCGSGSFLTAALQRGQDAWGIENDRDRIAIGHARVDTFGMDPSWKDRFVYGDATATPFEPDRFDIVLGHQFIEHVPDPAATISELMRITKRGGYVVLYAPDYRGPFEAHYEIPFPPFLSRERAKAWLDGFERPHGGLDYFFYTSAPQVAAIFEPMNCRIVRAYVDRAIETQVMRHFDVSTPAKTFECAQKVRAAFEARQLPENFMIATSFGIAAQKL